MSDELIRPPEENDRVSRLSVAPRAEVQDELVSEYEVRYQEPRKQKMMPRSYSTMNVTDEEKLWASIAHASIWVTMFGGFLTAGVTIPVSIFIPLIIYLIYRKKSDYVTFHALQAFTLQIIATVGVLAVVVVGGLAWGIGMVVALLAIFVLAGVVLVPLWAIVGVLLALVVFCAPLGALLLATIAAFQTFNRHDYRYPVISQWIDRQLAGGFLSTSS